jgi:hypothetical protein
VLIVHSDRFRNSILPGGMTINIQYYDDFKAPYFTVSNDSERKESCFRLIYSEIDFCCFFCYEEESKFAHDRTLLPYIFIYIYMSSDSPIDGCPDVSITSACIGDRRRYLGSSMVLVMGSDLVVRMLCVFSFKYFVVPSFFL